MSREAGEYWIKIAPQEPWEIAQWDADNGVWWLFASDVPMQPELVTNIIVGAKIEPPA